MEMKVILKNNLTLLHSIDVKGSSGTGIVEVIKVLKKVYTVTSSLQDHYINAHALNGYTYG